MLAIAYLALATIIGDRLCSRYLTFVSWPHRLSTAFLAGILASTWFTYLASFAFAKTSNPLAWGNAIFFIAAAGLLIYEKKTLIPAPEKIRGWIKGLEQGEKWDLITIGLFAIVAAWMMFATFSYADGTVRIANHQWSDFGSTVSLMQSFAEGGNFPTEYPHFTGDRIRYHFLYYFQAGNLEFLGLNPVLSNNLLSILSLVSMLVLVMTLGRVLFNSRTAGRIGALFFFFHGSLAFIPFLISTGSFTNLILKLSEMRDFLSSGFPYRGEDWGVWSQVVFLNQRHLASSIGILLIALVYLAMRYRKQEGLEPIGEVEEERIESSDPFGEGVEAKGASPHSSYWLKQFSPFILIGVLLGLLPLWNGAVFAAAVAVLGLALFLFRAFWKEKIVLAVAAGIVALPQVMFLKTGLARPAGYSLLHWGYTVEDPSFFNVFYYLVFSFGLKLILIAAAAYFSTGFQRRFLIAISGLIALAFCFQFSDEVLANHKFLNVWLVVANVFAAYGLVALWNFTSAGRRIAARAAAGLVTASIVLGGSIDLFPIKNGYWVDMKYEGDPLVNWIRSDTDKRAIFLSYRYVNHRILLAGRRLFYGHPYYSWSAGHDTGGRDGIYKKMFESTDADEVLRLLKENRISYVAIDNAIRKSEFIKSPNEWVYEAYFPVVFSDTEGAYDNLKIYRVPEELGAPQAPVQGAPDSDTSVREQKPAVDPFAGGEGDAPGQFSRPRGIAVDAKGNFYVADTGNSRVQKFTPDGKFVLSFGLTGDDEGQFRELNGVAVDDSNGIWALDAARHTLMRFDADGRFVKEWKGPETNFYGPRDLAFGANKRLYIVDQGRTRIVTFDPASEQFGEWGSAGSGEGQFHESTGVAVADGIVAVADTGNGRIQLFDPDGKFLRQWNVEAWGGYAWNRPDIAIDQGAKLIYVSSGISKEIVMFDLDGNLVGSIKPEAGEELTNPTSLAVFDSKKERQLYVLNTGGEVGFSGPPRVWLRKQ